MSRKSYIALLAELIGTSVLALIVLSINRYGLPIFTAMSAGVVYAVMYLVTGPISGAHLNPAITIGNFMLRRISAVKTVSFLAAQAIGAVAAWKLFEWFSDKPIKLASTNFEVKVFVAEIIGMAIFGFVISAVLYGKFSSAINAVLIGSGFFLGASLATLVTTAGVINPAVAISIGFRPENDGYLAYLFGPIIGAVVGMYLFKFMSVTSNSDNSKAEIKLVKKESKK